MRTPKTQGHNWGANSRRGGDGGVALVELAIVLPVLMCLLLGMITGGMALSRKIEITDAVREGARFGATVKVTDPANATQVAAWRTKVQTRITELSGTNISDLCVELVKSTNTTATTMAGAAPESSCGVKDPANSNGDYVVRVRGRGSYRLEAYFFSRDLTLEAKTAARYEREP